MASQNRADEPASGATAVRAGRRSGRHGRPSALHAAVHARLEEMRFSRGVLVMVAAGVLFVAAVTGITLAVTGSDAKPQRTPPEAEQMSPTTGSTGHSPTPRASSRRPRTSGSTVVGSARPVPATSHPAVPSGTPTALPTTWWPGHDGHPHWRYTSRPPWWHQR